MFARSLTLTHKWKVSLISLTTGIIVFIIIVFIGSYVITMLRDGLMAAILDAFRGHRIQIQKEIIITSKFGPN